MSIYKFMGGIVATRSTTSEVGAGVIKESYPEEAFDPHEYRIIRKPTSQTVSMILYYQTQRNFYFRNFIRIPSRKYLDTMTHMLKGAIGAGILAMPSAIKKVGVIPGVVILTIIGAICTYCIHLLIKVQYQLCVRHRRGYMAYPKSMAYAIKNGPVSLRFSEKFFYYFVDYTLLFWQIGICVVYFVFVAENLKQILMYFGIEVELRMLLVYLFAPFLLVNLVKDLKMLSPLSSISNLATILGLILVFYYLLEDDLVIQEGTTGLRSWEEVPNFIGTALFALEAVGVILALEYNMAEPKRFLGLFGLFNIAMAIILGLYMIVGLFGFLKYGDAIKASITLNLPQSQKKAQTAKGLISFAIFLSFPLQNFVAYNILMRKLRKRFSEDKIKMVDYLLRVGLVVLPWVCAVAAPNLGPIISLMGAFCLSLLAFVFPAIMSICVNYSEPDYFGIMHSKLIRDIFLLAMGTIILVSGVTASIQEIVAEFGHEESVSANSTSNPHLIRFKFGDWIPYF